MVQLVEGPTRHSPGKIPSGLDHIFTNTPAKISNVQKYFFGGSDHMLIKAVRLSKIIHNTPQYIQKRSYRDFDAIKFWEKVKQLIC